MSDQNRWKDVDAALRALATELCAADFEIGALLLAAEDTEPWLSYGYRSIYEYASRLFGWGYIATCERLRVAKALCELPGFAAELKSGRMTYCIVREATRIATPETEADWIAEFTGKTVRVVEAKAARHKRGDRPEDRGDPGLVRHRMHLEFTPRQWAIVTARLSEMRKGDPTLTDEELVSLLALAEIASENGESGNNGNNGASFKIQMRVEPDGTAFMEGGAGEEVEVPPSTLECAQCDAEVWEHTKDGPLKPVKRKAVPAAIERELKRLAKGRCECCGVRIKPQKHHVDLVSEGGSNDLSNFVLLCEAHHTRVHVGALIIDGSRDAGWIFRHADGSLYGGVDLDVSRLEASSEAFGALRKLGYAESLIKRALAGIRATSPDLSTNELIRAALNTLQRKRYRVVPHPAPRVAEPESPYVLFPRGNPLGSFHVERRPARADAERTGRAFPRGKTASGRGCRCRRRVHVTGRAPKKDPLLRAGRGLRAVGRLCVPREGC